MKKWLKIFLVILTFAAISVALYFILRAFGIANISTLRSIINKSGKWAVFVYVIILVFVLVCFSFVPLLNSALAILGFALFPSPVAFIANMVAIVFSTTILFFIGDKLGEKFVIKLIGKEALQTTQDKIHHKSKFWLPLLFITPGVPDEAICLIAGMTKIKFLPLLSLSILEHAVEFGTIMFFGSSLFNWGSLQFLDWVIVINLAIIDFYLLNKLEKYLSNKFSKK